MYMCMCTYRGRKRGPRNSGRESQSQTSFRWSFRVNEQETRKDIEGNVFHWFKKKSLQAHLVDRLPLPHLRTHLVEIHQLLHVVARETWTFISHHVTCRGKQALGSCWSCRNSKHTPRQHTQPREKMYSTVTSLVERILVLGKGNSASLPYLDLPVSDLCAWKFERIHSSTSGVSDQEIIDIFDWVVDVSWRIWILVDAQQWWLPASASRSDLIFLI